MGEYTIVLSGPGGLEGQLTKALGREGFTLVTHPPLSPRHVIAHGMTDTDEGDDPSIGWLTVRGEDVDKAAATAATLRWRLRAHRLTPAGALWTGAGGGELLAGAPTLEDRVAAIENALRGGQQ